MAPQSCSLNDLIRQNSHDRLFVQPLRWTSQHVKLLRCQFVQRSVRSTSGHLTPPNESEDDIQLQVEALRMAASGDLRDKKWNVARVLRDLSNDRIIRASNTYLELCYAGEPVAKLLCDTYVEVEGDCKKPFLAYIDLYDIARIRGESSVRVGKSRLRWKRSRMIPARLQSAKVEQDPYLVALLIALAQARRPVDPNGVADRQCQHTVHLLVTNNDDDTIIRLYNAIITPAFLRKFDKPSEFSDSDLVIDCAEFPTEPISFILDELAVLMKSPKPELATTIEALVTAKSPATMELPATTEPSMVVHPPEAAESSTAQETLTTAEPPGTVEPLAIIESPASVELLTAVESLVTSEPLEDTNYPANEKPGSVGPFTIAEPPATVGCHAPLEHAATEGTPEGKKRPHESLDSTEREPKKRKKSPGDEYEIRQT